jgi:hypothetical protein
MGSDDKPSLCRCSTSPPSAAAAAAEPAAEPFPSPLSLSWRSTCNVKFFIRNRLLMYLSYRTSGFIFLLSYFQNT